MGLTLIICMLKQAQFVLPLVMPIGIEGLILLLRMQLDASSVSLFPAVQR